MKFKLDLCLFSIQLNIQNSHQATTAEKVWENEIYITVSENKDCNSIKSQQQ